MNTGNFKAIQIDKGSANYLEANTLKVDNLILKDNIIQSDVGTSGKRIKELYETQYDTNVFTNREKSYLDSVIGKNSSVNGGSVISGELNRVAGKSNVMGSRNTVLANGSSVVGNNNTILHPNCTVIGNNCVSTKNDQVVVGGDNLSFRLPLADDILASDLPEQGMSICLDPADGSLLFKVKYFNEIRLFRAPTYGQTIHLNTAVAPSGKVDVTLAHKNM